MKGVSKSVFYAQPTSAVILGRIYERKRACAHKPFFFFFFLNIYFVSAYLRSKASVKTFSQQKCVSLDLGGSCQRVLSQLNCQNNMLFVLGEGGGARRGKGWGVGVGDGGFNNSHYVSRVFGFSGIHRHLT